MAATAPLYPGADRAREHPVPPQLLLAQLGLGHAARVGHCSRVSAQQTLKMNDCLLLRRACGRLANIFLDFRQLTHRIDLIKYDKVIVCRLWLMLFSLHCDCGGGGDGAGAAELELQIP